MMTLDYLQLDVFLLEVFLSRLASQSSIYLFSLAKSSVIVVEGFENDKALFRKTKLQFSKSKSIFKTTTELTKVIVHTLNDCYFSLIRTLSFPL